MRKRSRPVRKRSVLLRSQRAKWRLCIRRERSAAASRDMW